MFGDSEDEEEECTSVRLQVGGCGFMVGEEECTSVRLQVGGCGFMVGEEECTSVRLQVRGCGFIVGEECSSDYRGWVWLCGRGGVHLRQITGGWGLHLVGLQVGGCGYGKVGVHPTVWKGFM